MKIVVIILFKVNFRLVYVLYFLLIFIVVEVFIVWVVVFIERFCVIGFFIWFIWSILKLNIVLNRLIIIIIVVVKDGIFFVVFEIFIVIGVVIDLGVNE